MAGYMGVLSTLTLFDFTLFNCYKKRHLAAVVVYLALKFENSGQVRSRQVMEEGGIPEDVFKECSKALINLYNQREQLFAR